MPDSFLIKTLFGQNLKDSVKTAFGIVAVTAGRDRAFINQKLFLQNPNGRGEVSNFRLGEFLGTLKL